MTEKHDPLDNDETMMNLDSDDSDLSMGDMDTVGRMPPSDAESGEASTPPDDVSMGDMPTLAGGAGEPPAVRIAAILAAC